MTATILPGQTNNSILKPVMNNYTNTIIDPPLKTIIPAESMLKPYLPKVNTASTRVPATASTNQMQNSSMTSPYSVMNKNIMIGQSMGNHQGKLDIKKILVNAYNFQ